jgi:hypothetical protein
MLMMDGLMLLMSTLAVNWGWTKFTATVSSSLSCFLFSVFSRTCFVDYPSRWSSAAGYCVLIEEIDEFSTKLGYTSSAQGIYCIGEYNASNRSLHFASLTSILFHLNPSARSTETPPKTTATYQLLVNAALYNCTPSA